MSASSVVAGIDVAKAHVDAVLGAKLDALGSTTGRGTLGADGGVKRWTWRWW